MNLAQALVALTALVGAVSGLSALLTIPQRRRQISASATNEEATAASTLTGTALQLVQTARDEAKSAGQRADRAEERARDAERRAGRAERELMQCRLQLDDLYRRERDLEDAMVRADIPVPPRRRMYDATPAPVRRDDDPPETNGR